jgi:hypothetical protein
VAASQREAAMMSGKASLRCVAYRPAWVGTRLRYYATISFDDLMMTVSGIAIHVYPNGKVHAQLPAQAIGGQPVLDARGRPTCGPPILRFANEKVREAWVARVVEAVLKFDPDALDCREAAA